MFNVDLSLSGEFIFSDPTLFLKVLSSEGLGNVKIRRLLASCKRNVLQLQCLNTDSVPYT